MSRASVKPRTTQSGVMDAVALARTQRATSRSPSRARVPILGRRGVLLRSGALDRDAGQEERLARQDVEIVDPVRVPSLRSTLPPMPGTGGSGGTGSGLLGVFRSRLQRKGYTELMPPQPLELALAKSGPLTGTKIVAFVDLDAGTDGMQGDLTRLESWFDTTLPRKAMPRWYS